MKAVIKNKNIYYKKNDITILQKDLGTQNNLIST